LSLDLTRVRDEKRGQTERGRRRERRRGREEKKERGREKDGDSESVVHLYINTPKVAVQAAKLIRYKQQRHKQQRYTCVHEQ